MPTQPRLLKLARRCTAALGLLVASACAQSPLAQTPPVANQPSNKTSPTPSDVAVNNSRLRLEQTMQHSCQADQDCATVGVGARSCGGPEHYAAYSVRDTDRAQLQAAASAYAQLRQKQLEALGQMSTCDVLPDPGARCNPAGQCERRETRRGGSSGALIR